MNISQLKSVLPALIKNNTVPFIWGYQGVGKTHTVRQVAREIYGNEGFVHLHLATQEPGDLTGLLIHNEKEGTVKHARPEWFPTEETNGGRGGIVFLDELNRAHPDVIQCMFSFITDKTIHTHKLPSNWKIVAAGNYQTDEMTVTDTSDAAWMSRFCHIDFLPTVEEFVVHAENRGATSVSDFIAEHSEMLEAKNRTPHEVKVTPDRRAWLEMLSPLENEDMEEATRFEVYKGIVGNAAASAFMSFRKSNEKKIRLRDITKNYENVRARVLELSNGKETRFDQLSAPLDELTTRLKDNPKTLDANAVVQLKLYLLDIPLELLSQVSKKLSKLSFDGKDALINDPEFIKKLKKKK